MKFQVFHVNPGEKLKTFHINDKISRLFVIFPTIEYEIFTWNNPLLAIRLVSIFPQLLTPMLQEFAQYRQSQKEYMEFL